MLVSTHGYVRVMVGAPESRGGVTGEEAPTSGLISRVRPSVPLVGTALAASVSAEGEGRGREAGGCAGQPESLEGADGKHPSQWLCSLRK